MQSGKRQRRQAAALVVQSLWSSNSSKKKADKATKSSSNTNNSSSTNVRPVLEVPPMGFGPIRDPNSNDVLCGRGGLINGSVGNVQFRTIVSTKKKEYNAKTTKRNEKAHLAAEIVRHIRSMTPPGRFLREDANGMWFDIGDARAIRKTGQALREAAPTIRQELEGGGADTADNKTATDSGSDDGSHQDDEPQASSGKDKKATEASTKMKKKELKAKKQAAKKQFTKKATVQPEMNAAAPIPSSEASVASSTATATTSGRRSWIPGRGSRNNDAAEAAPRSSHSFLIPTSALGPHITGSVTSVVPAGNMPRMSAGPVFSNHHSNNSSNSTGLRASAPPVLASDQHPPPPHHYPHPHPNAPQHLYPYPYAHPMHPMHHMPPPHMHPQQHHLPPGAVPPMHPSAVYHPSMGVMGGYPQDAAAYGTGMGNMNQDAFGMNFYPTNNNNDVAMEQQSSCTLSDISGLSSSVMTGDPRKQKHPIHMHHYNHAASSSHRAPKLEGVPPQLVATNNTIANGSNNNMNNAGAAPAAMDDSSSVPMIDTTSSLPSFSDLLDDDDVDMASAMSGKGSSLAMGSVSSSTMAKFMGPGPTSSGNNNNNNNNMMMMKPPPSSSQPFASGNNNKRNTGMTMKAPVAGAAKENTGSCLSGKSGSCLSGKSGKSELSLPSSCGTNISAFSDTFMALHLSDHHEFE